MSGSYSHHERLTALDSLFLDLENHDIHMHVGATALFDAQPLRDANGRFDFAKVRAFTDAALHNSPRFRQKLRRVPVLGQPVWIDDDRFNLDYHVRHTALPGPGSLRQLKRLVGRIMSQKLEREKPLWEMWVVEGLDDGRFAVIWKAHHCMVDGIAGIDLLAQLLRLDTDAGIAATRSWMPRPAPSQADLLAAEVTHRLTLPAQAIGGLPELVRAPQSFVDSAMEGARAAWEALSAGLEGTSPTPFNTDIGPYRRCDWTRTSIAEITGIRERFGGTLNDVVLATAAGAIGRFLAQRGQRIDARSVIRAMVPVSIRRNHERGEQGNRVVNFLCRLPVDVADPVQRLERMIETTRAMKRSRVAAGSEMFEDLSDHTFTSLLVQIVRMTARQRSFNTVITNVPGPPFPVYLLGAQMHEIYPVVPLFEGQGLGFALFSYDGQLCWGFNSDWDALPDLHELVELVESEFGRLRDAAASAAPARSAMDEPIAAPAKKARRKRAKRETVTRRSSSS